MDTDSTETILPDLDEDHIDDRRDQLLYADQMTRLPDHLLKIPDRRTMPYLLGRRSLLIEYSVIEYTTSILSGLELCGRNLKYVLRRFSEMYLFEELINHCKQDFGRTLSSWMNCILGHTFKKIFVEPRLVEPGTFAPAVMRALLEENLYGKSDHNSWFCILEPATVVPTVLRVRVAK